MEHPRLRPARLRTDGPAGPLLLRPPARDDVDAITDACQDPVTQRWTSIPVPYSRADAVAFVEEYAAGGWASGQCPVFAVTDPAGRYLASFDLRLDGSGMGTVGFAVAPWARGRGVGRDALRRVCRWGFDDLGLARVEWWAYVGNEASRRTALSVGFRMEGTCRSRFVARGRRHDAWVAGLLPGDLR